MAIGTGVTALVHRYNPVVVAQQVATLGALFPGRVFIGVGSGEAMNEVPAGLSWPVPAVQLARTEEALQIVTRLLDGGTISFEGRYFRTVGARLYLPDHPRPPVFMSAFGPESAEIAGRYADGIWTLADPQKAPKVIAAYRRSCEESGKQAGEVILQGLISWAETDDEALENSREWKPTLVDANYAEGNHRTEQVAATAQNVSDDKFRIMGIISADPDIHIKKIKLLSAMGATAIVLMNVSGKDPHGTLRLYGEELLPKLRG